MTPRRALAVSFALFLAAPAFAQKPTPEDGDPERARYRDRVLAACVSDLAAADGMTGEQSESICGCAAGRFLPRWPTGALPPLSGAHMPGAMSAEIMACTGDVDVPLAASIARRLAEIAVAESPMTGAPQAAKPQAAPSADGTPSPGFDPSSWLDGVHLPRWLTASGLPAWAWAPLALFVLLFLRGLMRGSGDKDLMGPPSRMRRPRPPSAPRRP